MAIDPDVQTKLDEAAAADQQARDALASSMLGITNGLQASVDALDARVVALESTPDPDPVPDPQPTGEVLTWAEIEARPMASYKMPIAQDGANEMGYAVGVHAQLADGTILAHGHPYYGSARKFQFPASGDTMEPITDWANVQGPTPAGVDGGEWKLGGLWEDSAGQIHEACYLFYNGSGNNFPTFGVSPNGSTKFANHHNGALGGAISTAPTSLPFDFICGNAGLSASNPRDGVNVFGVSIDANGDYTSTALIRHDQANPQPGWWIADQQHSAVFVEHTGKSALLVFVTKGLTNLGYGEQYETDPAQGLQNDHYEGGKGYHADSYEAAVLVYDPADINAVLAGGKQPHEVSPVEKVRLIHGDENGVVTYQSVIATGNPVGELHATISGGRLLILQEAGYAASPYSKTPMVYEFQL